MRNFCLVLLLFIGSVSWSQELAALSSLNLESPRATMRTFMEAMNDYKKGLETNNGELKGRLDDAARCFNLESVAVLNRRQVGRESAIFLKEIIDRVWVVDYEQIPEAGADPAKPIANWKIPNTELAVARVEKGENEGKYLFTASTMEQLGDIYEKVKDLPYLKGTTKGAGYKEPWLQKRIPKWAMVEFIGLAIWQWIGIGVAILLGLVMRMIVAVVLKIIDRVLHTIPTDWAKQLIEVLASPIALLATTAVWFLALYVLQLKGMLFNVANFCLQVVLFGALTWLFYNAVDLITPNFKSFVTRKDERLNEQLMQFINRALKIIVIILGVLLALQNFGVQVASLLAGLGIGGLAVALAARETLANFFGSLTIMFDGPFKVGDRVIIKNVEGTVEDVGFRSTKIRTVQNSVVFIPNAELANSNIENLDMREYRRVQTNIGIAYDTPQEKMDSFIQGIREILEKHPYTRKDPGTYNVAFHDITETKLSILVNFYLKTNNLAFELAERQHVLFEIMQLAKKLEIRFAG